MLQPKRWNIATPAEAADQLAACLKTSPLIAQILLNRGISAPDDCRRFLSPSLKDLHAPSEIHGLAAAADRVARAIKDREPIVIYGDYDVDGITGTATLWHAIRLLGGQVDYYIPHRLEEGYGLNAEAVTQLCDSGARLIITVDCGITAIAEAAVARQRNVDLIVTDHHDYRAENGVPLLPDCCNIVHPRIGPAGAPAYRNPYLCGSGVAFKLAWGIGRAVSGADRVSPEFRNFLVEATGLAALGTIADVVPLLGENRLLAHFGLGGLKQSQLHGIQALIRSAGLDGQKLDSYHVGFLLAPRLNACGRMGHAREAVEMLTNADPARAAQIAIELDAHNRARQAIERKIFDQAMAQVEQLGLDKSDCRGIVLGAEDWHPGVIGIVASRVVNRLNRPTVMIALANGHGHGSARSIPGFHLARALDACREHLEACGGHEMAAGLRLTSDRFPAFREAFAAYAHRTIAPELLIPEINIDCVAELRQITASLVGDLARLGPFGTANCRPLLCCKDVELAAAPRRCGRSGEHLQLLIRQGGLAMKCIAFRQGETFDHLRAGMRIDLAVEPSINDYQGRSNVELEVRDIRTAQ